MKKFLSIIVPVVFFLFIVNFAFAANTIEIPGSSETTYKVQIKTNEGSWQLCNNSDPPNIDFDGNISIRGYAFYLNETGDRTTQVTDGNVTLGATKATEQYCGNLDATGYNFECSVNVEDILPSGCHIGENCTIYIWVNDTDGLEGNRSLKLWIRELNITDEYDNQFQLTFSDEIVVNETVYVSGYVYYKKEYDSNNASIYVPSVSMYIEDPCDQKTYGSGGWSTSRDKTDSTGKFYFAYKPNCTGTNKKFKIKARDSNGIEEYFSTSIDILSKSSVSDNRSVDLTEIKDISKIVKDTPTSVIFDESKVKELVITTDRRILHVELTLEELSNLTSISAPSEEVYKYINITKVNLSDSYITNVNIYFKVPISWTETNNIDKNTIKLIKYSSSWNDISTSYIRSDNNYYHYNATTDALSVFAIVGEELLSNVKTSDYLNITTYPETISVEQGQNKTESVTIKNIKTTANQTVELTLIGIDSSWYSTTPTSSIITSNTNETFNITFNIPSNTTMKDYTCQYNASSSYDYTTKNFTLSILPGSELKNKINTTLANYSAKFNEIEIRYNETKNKGINTTSVDTLYNDLKSKLNSAISFRDSNDYKSAYDLLDDIKDGLTKTEQELDKLLGVSFWSGSWTKKILIFVVIGGVIGFVFYLFWPTSLKIPKLRKTDEEVIAEQEEGKIKDKYDEEFEKVENKKTQDEIKDKYTEEYDSLEKNQKHLEQEDKEG